MKYVIFESGGKQYKAVEGSTVDVDRMDVEPGQEIVLENVLLSVADDSVTIGTPLVKDVSVKATVVREQKGPKLIVFKYRPKKRYRVKTGHRQVYTRLMIDAIEG